MDEQTRLRHSVGCYFCGTEFDERESGRHADDYNDGDGGSICNPCGDLADAHNAGEHTTSWDGCPYCERVG